MDREKLINALENEKNENILYTDYSNIKNEKNDILQRLPFNREQLKTLHKKLKYYRYADNPDELEFGHYIRWINLKNPENLRLTNGGIVIDMSVVNDMLYLTCKNNMNRVFRLNFNQCIVFQKLTNQENILLQVMDYLNKK